MPIGVEPDGSVVTVVGVVTADQGTAAPCSAAWPFKLSDGTVCYKTVEDFQLPASLDGAGRLKTTAMQLTDPWIVGGRDTASAAQTLSVKQAGDPTDSTDRTLLVSTGFDVIVSTDTALGAGAVFQSAAVDISAYNDLTLTMFATPDGATGKYQFEFSVDGVNWDVQVPVPINNATVFIPFPLRSVARFFRITYTNGATPQASFRLRVLAHRGPAPGLIRTPTQVIGVNEPVTVNRSLIEPSLRGHISILGADRSIGGEGITLPYVLQVQASFNQSFVSNAVSVTTAGGGTAVQASATGATISTAAAAGASSATIVSSTKIRYLPGREFRSEFSVAFLMPGIANSTSLVGLSDQSGTLNRLALGYVGATFGFFIYSGGVITPIPQASWNGDPLNGSAFSEFTSGGRPVPLDITLANAWRIRGVWFGVGPVYLEVKSPDDRWVVAHTLRYPNTAIVPYIEQPDMFVFAEVTKNAGAGVGTVQSRLFCWDGGTTESDLDFEPHEILSRSHAAGAAGAQVANVTAWTVSTGRQLFVKALNITCLNSSLVANGQLNLIDATAGVAGTLLHSLTMATATNQSASQVVQPITMPVPMIALTGLRFIVVSGTLIFSYSFQGYEKRLL